jgi:LuxR family maltose regulon positive regulatory protein
MVMASPLLETKLFIPTRRRGLVARLRLSERLNRGTEAKLTLISAPAGFGKTTLLADWLEVDPANGRSTAWLSLEQSDNDLALFWTYLITALQTAAPAIAASPLSLLHSSQSPIEVIFAPGQACAQCWLCRCASPSGEFEALRPGCRTLSAACKACPADARACA